ncbi:MAG: hypothetical protein KDA21_14040 [Phycisphaerales bacterium]|nr:hypothetical protein [Phycisphaerales bacterium]
MIRVVFGAAVGALTVFFVGFIFWVLLPVPFSIVHDLPRDQTAAMLEQLDLPGSGVYHYPGFPLNEDGSMMDEAATAALEERFRTGPTISMMVYHDGGRDMFPMWQIPASLVINFVAALFAALMLRVSGQRCWLRRAFIVTAAGVLAGVAGNANHFMWFMVPYDFAVYSIATTVVAWAVASLPLAAIVRPGAGAAACATPDAP